MTKRHLLQVDVGAAMEAEIEAVAAEDEVSKSDAARSLLRRGLKDRREEQELLRRMREKPSTEGGGLADEEARTGAA